jgi:predicted GNAT family acetyltransferase
VGRAGRARRQRPRVGAFDGTRLVSIAATFFLGVRHEELAVVTEPAYRGRGLSTGCVAALCRDVLARGRVPSWSTGRDNTASRREAEKAGFTLVRHDVLYVVGVDVPTWAR